MNWIRQLSHSWRCWQLTSGVRHGKPRPAAYCTVLPPGELNGMIPCIRIFWKFYDAPCNCLSVLPWQQISFHYNTGSFYFLDQSFAETKRLIFGLRPELRLTNHCGGAHHCSLHNVIADVITDISWFIYELAKKWSDSRSSELNL